MKLKKFRIKNYKSIKDSGWCDLASDITILAGKNESGKSSILEALQAFGKGKLDESVRPISSDEESEPTSIEACFELPLETLDEVKSEVEMGESIYERFKEKKEISFLIEHSGGNCHRISPDLREMFSNQENGLHSEIDTTLDSLQSLNVERPYYRDQEEMQRFIDEINTKIEPMEEGSERDEIRSKVNYLTQLNEDYQKYRKEYTSLLKKFLSRIPKFIFFGSGRGLLPYETPFGEAEGNGAIKDFAKVAGFDLKETLDPKLNSTDRRNRLSGCSAKITGNFQDYWEQDKLELKAEADGDKLRIGFEEEGQTNIFRADQRSEGLQWFVSFYLRIQAHQSGDDRPTILLIDEPGLYLHAKAQQNMLKVLEDKSKKDQIVFSTHSPYLLDAKRMDRIRLILKDKKKGTRIEGKIHRVDQDKHGESITPILTAIGDEIGSGLSLSGKYNIITEGISDYYYLNAFKLLFSKENEDRDSLHFIPSRGSSTIPYLISILMGWGSEFVVLLDNDKGKKNCKKELEKLMVGDRIVLVSKEKGASIENLFAEEDREKHIGGENGKLEGKALLSKTFFEKVKNDEIKFSGLSDETKKNFKDLFKRIRNKFSEQPFTAKPDGS